MTAITKSIYYGWFVVAAAFAVMLLGFAAAYSFSAYFPLLEKEFAASRASISLVFSVGAALYFFVGALSGPLSDRFGPRWICVCGFIALGAGLFLASRAESLTVVYIGFGLGIGLGVGFSYVPSIGAVQPWFTTRRGLASGLAVSGIGLGTLIGPLLSDYLIDTQGWRATLAGTGLFVMVAGALASLVLENDPSLRASERMPSAPPQTVAPASLSLRQALATRSFWLLYGSAAALSFALFVPFVHLVPYALDHGFSASTGALLIGLVGIGSTIGRFLVGWLADKFGRLNVYVASFVCVVGTFLIWLVAAELWVLVCFALLFGTAYGGFVALAPALTVDYFGTRSAAGIIGAVYSSVGIGTLLGPPFAGYIFDQSGSYAIAILVGELMACVAVGLAMLLPEPVR